MNKTPFSLATVFYAADAMEDKIDLRVGIWNISGLGNDDAYFKFKEHLGAPPSLAKAEAWNKLEAADATWHGDFFTRPHSQGKMWNKLQIRRLNLKHPKKNLIHKAPLCGGYCKFSKSKNSQAIKEPPLYLAELDLSLNLQRYMRHQPLEDDPILTGAFDDGPQLQPRSKDRYHYANEFSFDGTDNWIPDTPGWRKFASPAPSRGHLNDYLNLILEKMDAEMERACAVAKHLIHFSDYGWKPKWHRKQDHYSLSKVETMWEFPSDNPIAQVMEIGGRLMQIKRVGGKSRQMKNEFKEVGRMFNTPCFTVPIAETAEIKVYAKTNRRIRFEIVHLLHKKKQRTALLGGMGIDASKDYFPLSELPPLLQALRKRAANLLNGVMAELRKSKAVNLKALSVLDLFSEVAFAVPHELPDKERVTQMQMLLFQLCYQGGFRCNSKTGAFAQAVNRLRERKVILWDGSQRFFTLHPNFIPAKESLMSKTGDPFLAIIASMNSVDGIQKIGNKYVRVRE